MNDIEEQLKQLQQQEANIAQRKAELEAEMQRRSDLDKRLDEIVKNSGYTSPRDLAQALISKYGLRLARAAAITGEKQRRKRTRITAELRDNIKKLVNDGTSMNAVSKQQNISYTVVAKIIKGHYDKVN
jgi:multidrug efflux pump subunit AcrA (membrane-fusion protein)